MGVLDLGKLRGALVRLGLADDDDSLGAAAVFATERMQRGQDPALAAWFASRDVLRGRSPIRQRDYLRWGACSVGRGVGVYRLADGSRVRYRGLMPGEISWHESRESDPAVLAAVSELESGAVSGSCVCPAGQKGKVLK